MAKKKTARRTGAKARAASKPKTGSMTDVALMKAVKKLAAKQPISIALSEEQAKSILSQWKDNPRRPAKIVFRVGSKRIAELAVASYRYRGDTCCV